MISSVPKRTTRPIGALIVETRAVTLSSPCNTATSYSSAPAFCIHKHANKALTAIFRTFLLFLSLAATGEENDFANLVFKRFEILGF